MNFWNKAVRISWSNTEVILTVPEQLSLGKVKIATIISSVVSNGVDFNVIEYHPILPEINLLMPTEGIVGDTISIIGINFGKIQYKNFVTFNKVSAEIYYKWDDSEIKVVVPENLPEGLAVVAVHVGDNISNSHNFLVLKNPPLPEKDMVQIPAGTFFMGDQTGRGYIDERPFHEVTLTRSFQMSKYEVTQKEWFEVTANNPSAHKGDNYPVESISFEDMIDYCNHLSALKGLQSCYTYNNNLLVCDFDANGYRLPTSAEWEYACRARTTTEYYSGNGEGNRNRAGWFSSNSNGSTHPVGQKEPNNFGLYDMHGNVWEMVWDWWKADYYNHSPMINPTGHSQPTGLHTQRGGSYIDPLPFGTCSDLLNNKTGKGNNFGFRLVRTIRF